MRIKKIGIGREYSSYEEVKEQHVVSQGWWAYGDLSFLCNPHERFYDYIDRISDWTQRGKNAFKQLFREIKAGDIVLAFEGNSLRGICEVPKDHVYFFNDEVDDYKNCIFPVEWVDWNEFCQGSKYVDFMQGGQGVAGIQNFYTPHDLWEYIADHWPKYKENTGLQVQPAECQEKLDKLKAELPQRIIDTKIRYMEKLKEEAKGEYISKFVKLLKSNYNLILHGAPGTGKTHTAIEIAKALGAEWCKVQFHPSYDYSDFVEGLRPVRTDDGQIGFARKSGIFMSFCEKALKSSLIDVSDNFENAWDALTDLIDTQGFVEVDLITKKRKFVLEFNATKGGLVSDKYVDPATGEHINAAPKFMNKDQLERVYKGGSGVNSGGHDSYRKAIIEFMKSNPAIGLKDYDSGKIAQKKRDFVFIIDEINRGDISKIFGELFSCVEAGYRGKGGHVFTQYSNLVEAPTVFDEIVDKGGTEFGRFFVPENVYIIGTMNDIDRSVESMDFAMRRRFAFEEIKAKDSALAMGLNYEQMQYMTRLNQAIVSDEIGLDESFQIGGSYFLNVADFDALWRGRLRGLLKEYLRGADDIAGKLMKLENAFYGKD